MNGVGSTVGEGYTYLWTAAPSVPFDNATILSPIGTFLLGTTDVTLTVTFTDPTTFVATSCTDAMQVVISDPTAPQVCASADPDQLWPPNHELHDVHVNLRVYDLCDANPDVALVSIESNEPDNGKGDGNTPDDIVGAELGTDDRDFALRAERSGHGDGRVYAAQYSVTDLANNQTNATALVSVPHDMGHGATSDGDACHDTDQSIKHAIKADKKAAKAQLKAAKKAAKAAKKAYKAALRASR
jgi:hypothetical protein